MSNGKLMQLPVGWIQCKSKSTQKVYYFNTLTKVSSWKHPARISVGEASEGILRSAASAAKEVRHICVKRKSSSDGEKTLLTEVTIPMISDLQQQQKCNTAFKAGKLKAKRYKQEKDDRSYGTGSVSERVICQPNQSNEVKPCSPERFAKKSYSSCHMNAVQKHELPLKTDSKLLEDSISATHLLRGIRNEFHKGSEDVSMPLHIMGVDLKSKSSKCKLLYKDVKDLSHKSMKPIIIPKLVGCVNSYERKVNCKTATDSSAKESSAESLTLVPKLRSCFSSKVAFLGGSGVLDGHPVRNVTKSCKLSCQNSKTDVGESNALSKVNKWGQLQESLRAKKTTNSTKTKPANMNVVLEADKETYVKKKGSQHVNNSQMSQCLVKEEKLAGIGAKQLVNNLICNVSLVSGKSTSTLVTSRRSKHATVKAFTCSLEPAHISSESAAFSESATCSDMMPRSQNGIVPSSQRNEPSMDAGKTERQGTQFSDNVGAPLKFDTEVGVLNPDDCDVEMMDLEDAPAMKNVILKEIQDFRGVRLFSKPKVPEFLENDVTSDAYKNALYVVLDTNILLGHLKFVSELKDYLVPGYGAPTLIIPWVVLQELDGLKAAVNRTHRVTGSAQGEAVQVNILAQRAIKFINTCLTAKHPRVKGQSCMESAVVVAGFKQESNDDSIIHCGLVLKSRAPKSQVVILSNDCNLCNKAIVVGLRAFSEQNVKGQLRNLLEKPDSIGCVDHHEEFREHNVPQEQITQPKKESLQADATFCELQCILREGLSKVIQTEMMEAYDKDLWLKVIKVQPPWTLHDVFMLLERHWVAVFRFVVKQSVVVAVKDLMSMFSRMEGSTGSLDDMKEMARLSLLIFEAFAAKSDYDAMMPRCLAALRELISKLEQPLVVGQSATATGQETGEQAGQAVARVMDAFDCIWQTVTDFSALIFRGLDYPSPLVNRLDPAVAPPSKEECFEQLCKLGRCLEILVHKIQGVIGPVQAGDSGDTKFGDLLDSMQNFSRQIMSRECLLTLPEVQRFCMANGTRSTLVQGLSQLQESLAMLQLCGRVVMNASSAS